MRQLLPFLLVAVAPVSACTNVLKQAPSEPALDREPKHWEQHAIIVADAELPHRQIFDDLPAVLAQELGEFDLGSPAQAHRISVGSGTVISWQRYYDEPDSNDEELFEKLTIWMPGGLKTRDKAELLSDRALALYSHASSRWVTPGCHGRLAFGEVRYRRLTPNTFRVSVTGTIRGHERPILGKVAECVRTIDLDFAAEAREPDTLAPWLGERTYGPPRDIVDNALHGDSIIMYVGQKYTLRVPFVIASASTNNPVIISDTVKHTWS